MYDESNRAAAAAGGGALTSSTRAVTAGCFSADELLGVYERYVTVNRGRRRSRSRRRCCCGQPVVHQLHRLHTRKWSAFIYRQKKPAASRMRIRRRSRCPASIAGTVMARRQTSAQQCLFTGGFG